MDPADDRFEVVNAHRPRVQVTVPADDIERMRCVHVEAQPVARAHEYRDFFSVCLVQPDGVASVSDESMQQAVSRKIAQFLRSTDVVARTRDGIAILLLNTPDHDATRVAERIRSHVENVSFQPDPAAAPRRVTLSVGLVSFPRDGHNETMLLTRAQSRLQTAAQRGGNQVIASNGA